MHGYATPASRAGVSELEATLLAEAHRQLDQQLSELDSLRSRAVGVLSAAGIIAGLFVGRLTGHVDVYAWAALALLVVTVGCAVWIIRPRSLATGEDLRSALDWYRLYAERPHAAETFMVSTADNLRQDRDGNRAVLHQAAVALLVECVLLGVQLLLWVLSTALA